MKIRLMMDLSPDLLKRGWANYCEGVFLSPMYFLFHRGAYQKVNNIVNAGGLHSHYQIPENCLIEYGCDRNLTRSALDHLKEAISLKPDVIVPFDVPLTPKDTEDEIVAKLAVNHDSIEQYDRWLKEKGLRIRFMLAGVVHSDHLQGYLEEADHVSKFCEIIGISAAGLTLARKYQHLTQILNLIAKNIPKPIQLFGYGISNINQLQKIVDIAKKRNAYLILEGSTLVRQSRARTVLALTSNSDAVEYKNISYVADCEDWNAEKCFQHNIKILKTLVQKL